MKLPFPQKVTTEAVFVWLMHRIAEEFADHAIIKGGMSLRLLDCPRHTNDIDYVFVPYASKKDIASGLKKIFDEIPNAKIVQTMNSKAINASIVIGGVSVQVEASVSLECKSVAMSTSSLARNAGQLGRVVRIMSLDVALAHKLAAWNERRLIRDIYDAYYIFRSLGTKPDLQTLTTRLGKIDSRLPKNRGVKKMSMNEFAAELKNASAGIDNASVKKELSALFSGEELAGLDIKLKASMYELAEYLSANAIG